MVTNVTVPVHEALQWKLNKGQTLHNALTNYAILEDGVSKGVINPQAEQICSIHIDGGNFIVEIES